MPNYNGARYIGQAIESVMNQSFCNWELLIVDDKSKDNSIEIIKSFVKDDLRVSLFILDDNKGVSFARNLAISKSKGRYIAFLDCDDLWKPEKLVKQLELIKKECALIYSSYELINGDNVKIGSLKIKFNYLSYNDMLRNNYIGCLTALYDTKIVGKMYMNENLKSHEDLLLWLKILEKSNIAFGCEEILASYRIAENSLSSRKIKQASNHWGFLRSVLKIAFFPSLYFFSIYSLNSISRKVKLGLYQIEN